jgi:hypothetical protein
MQSHEVWIVGIFYGGRHAPLAQGDPGQPPPLRGRCQAETCRGTQANVSLCVRLNMPRYAALGGRGMGLGQPSHWHSAMAMLGHMGMASSPKS